MTPIGRNNRNLNAHAVAVVRRIEMPRARLCLLAANYFWVARRPDSLVCARPRKVWCRPDAHTSSWPGTARTSPTDEAPPGSL